MRALSLWQPWATLWALGIKRAETRSWSTTHRGPLLVHAAKRRPTFANMSAIPRDVLAQLAAAGIASVDAFPFGSVVGVVELAQVVEITPRTRAELGRWTPHELDLGDFRPGRFAWIPSSREVLDPAPAVGRQGLFELEPPDGLPSGIIRRPSGELAIPLPALPADLEAKWLRAGHGGRRPAR